HLQPLFMARYASNAELGPPRIDLFIDSLSLELGAFWAAPRGGSMRETPGLELGIAMAFPILADASGPFLEARGAVRWRDEDLKTTGKGDVIDRGALVTVMFTWHQVVGGHVVDVRDRKR